MESDLIGMDGLHNNEAHHESNIDESAGQAQQSTQPPGSGGHGSVGSPSAQSGAHHAHAMHHHQGMSHQDQLNLQHQQHLAAFQQQQHLLAHQQQFHHHMHPHFQQIPQQFIDPAMQVAGWHPHPGTAHPHQLHHLHHHPQQAQQPLAQAHPHGANMHAQHAVHGHAQYNQQQMAAQQQAAVGSGSDGGSGSDDDDDEGGKKGGGKRKRQMKSPEQLSLLEKEFAVSPLPNKETRYRISALIGLTPRQVQIWFQNKRAKVKNAQRKRGSGFTMQSGQPGMPVQPGQPVPQMAGSPAVDAVKGSPKRRKTEGEEIAAGQFPPGQPHQGGYPAVPHGHQHQHPHPHQHLVQHPHQHIHPQLHPQMHAHLAHLQPAAGHPQHAHVHIQPQLAPQYYMGHTHAFPQGHAMQPQQSPARAMEQIIQAPHQRQQVHQMLQQLPQQPKVEQLQDGSELDLNLDAEKESLPTGQETVESADVKPKPESENGQAHDEEANSDVTENKAKEAHSDAQSAVELSYRIKSICKKAKKARDDDEDRETEFADIGEELNSEIEQLRERVTAILGSEEGESEDQGAECLELLTAFTDSFTREWPSDVDSEEATKVHQSAREALSRVWSESFASLQSTMPAKLTTRWTEAAASLNVTINSN